MDIRAVRAIKERIEYVMWLQCLEPGLYAPMPLSAGEAEEMMRKLRIHCQQKFKSMRSVQWVQEKSVRVPPKPSIHGSAGRCKVGHVQRCQIVGNPEPDFRRCTSQHGSSVGQ